jgi:hypothetical protein
MTSHAVQRDERTVSIENTSYRLAYLILSFGLLLSVAYRGFVRHEQAWDLMALVVIGGAVATLYQGTHHVLSRRWLMMTLASVVVAVLVAIMVIVFLT